MGPGLTPDGKGEWGKNQKDCYPELSSDGAYIGFDNKWQNRNNWRNNQSI